MAQCGVSASWFVRISNNQAYGPAMVPKLQQTGGIPGASSVNVAALVSQNAPLDPCLSQGLIKPKIFTAGCWKLTQICKSAVCCIRI